MRPEENPSSGRHHGPDEQVDWLGRRPKHPAPDSGPVLNSDHSCLPCWYFPFLYRNASKNLAGTVPSPTARTIAQITRRESCLLTSAPSARDFRSRYWASCCHTSRRAPLHGQSPGDRAPGDARSRLLGHCMDHDSGSIQRQQTMGWQIKRQESSPLNKRDCAPISPASSQACCPPDAELGPKGPAIARVFAAARAV